MMQEVCVCARMHLHVTSALFVLWLMSTLKLSLFNFYFNFLLGLAERVEDRFGQGKERKAPIKGCWWKTKEELGSGSVIPHVCLFKPTIHPDNRFKPFTIVYDFMLHRIEKKIAQTNVKIEKMELDMKTKEDLKTVALGTSKINYLDPRITVAWCKRHEVPIEKVNSFCI